MKMKLIKTTLFAAALLATTPTLVLAKDSRYTYGTVRETHGIKVKSGQFKNYMDHLAAGWKQSYEMGKEEGYVVDYHVLASTRPREGEADLVLVVEFKVFTTTAQRKEIWDKMQKKMSTNDRKSDKEYSDRKVMRESLSSSQYQELNLK
jgi:hypothetical protein